MQCLPFSYSREEIRLVENSLNPGSFEHSSDVIMNKYLPTGQSKKDLPKFMKREEALGAWLVVLFNIMLLIAKIHKYKGIYKQLCKIQISNLVPRASSLLYAKSDIYRTVFGSISRCGFSVKERRSPGNEIDRLEICTNEVSFNLPCFLIFKSEKKPWERG